MRIVVGSFLLSLTLATGALAQTQPRSVSAKQVGAMVEALRQAAPKTNNPNDGLYSDWQVKPDTIRGWSSQCLGRELTPTQFENSPVTARSIITCVVKSEFGQLFRAASNNEMKAVQNMACWWMTGQANACKSGATASYVQQVTRLYQKLR